MLRDALQASQHVIVNVLRCYMQTVTQQNSNSIMSTQLHTCNISHQN